MSQKGITSLTNTLNAAITDQIRKENTSVRVRGLQQDFIDSFLNKTDGGAITGNLSANSLYVYGTLISPITLTQNEIAFGTGSAGLMSSNRFILSGINRFVDISVESMGTESWGGVNINSDHNELNQGNLFRYHMTMPGNIPFTSIPYADLLQLNHRYNLNEGAGAIAIRGLPIYNLAQDTVGAGLNMGSRLDTTGFRIADVSTLHSANTKVFEAGAITVSAGAIAYNGTDLNSLYATFVHTHAISDVTNLSGSLNSKASLSGANFTSLSATSIYSGSTNLSALFMPATYTPPATVNFVDGEDLTADIDGVTQDFTLINIPSDGSVHLYLNGLRLREGITNDYVHTPGTADIQMNTAPSVGDVLIVDYRY